MLSWVLVSCGLEPNEYIAWVRDYDNGLHVKKSFNDFEFDVQYQTPDYLALISPSSEAHVNDSLQHYILNIGVVNSSISIAEYKAENLSDKQRRLYYLSYNFQNDIFLEEEGAVLPCVLFHAEQSLSPGNTKTFLVAFKGNPSRDEGETKLIIKSDLFGSLPVKIKILKSSPTVRKI
jgi:hypothetical protein